MADMMRAWGMEHRAKGKGQRAMDTSMRYAPCSLPFTQRGFSLVELLIAMAVATVVGMAGYVIFSSSNWSYKVQEDVSEAQQNVRVAMDRLAKDIRMAGFGLPDPPFNIWFDANGNGAPDAGETFTSPITVTASSSTAPDSITILGIGYEAAKLIGYIPGPPEGGENIAGNNSICVDTDSAFLTQFANRKYISIGGITYKELTAVPGITCGVTGRRLNLAVSLDRSYPNNTPVFIIQAVTYSRETTGLTGCSATNPCLATNDLTQLRDGGMQVLAENIEDIQFAYGVDGTISPTFEKDGKIDYTGSYTDTTAFYFSPTGPTALSDPSSIIAVRANIVARTRNTDARGATFRRQCLEDRSDTATCGTVAAPATDGYRRRVLTKLIKIRNPKTGA